MRVGMFGVALAAAASGGCGLFGGGGGGSGGGGQGSSGGAGGGNVVTLEAARVEGGAREDRVNTSDAPAPDGTPDMVFNARVGGRVSAMILTVCDDVGRNTTEHWDTVVGQTALPDGYMFRLGTNTRVLGVMNAEGRMLNNGDGSLPELNFERPAALRLFASVTDGLQPGRLVCLTVLRPDGSATTGRAELR